jgi:hypothetical protein
MSARITASLFGAALALTVTAAQAAEDTRSANYMLPYCRLMLGSGGIPPNNISHVAFCNGMVVGLSYAAEGLCAPDGVTHGQLMRVVVQYIDQRPQRMHESFLMLAHEALRAAWPCR